MAILDLYKQRTDVLDGSYLLHMACSSSIASWSLHPWDGWLIAANLKRCSASRSGRKSIWRPSSLTNGGFWGKPPGTSVIPKGLADTPSVPLLCHSLLCKVSNELYAPVDAPPTQRVQRLQCVPNSKCFKLLRFGRFSWQLPSRVTICLLRVYRYLSDKLYSKRSPVSFIAVCFASAIGFTLTYHLHSMS